MPELSEEPSHDQPPASTACPASTAVLGQRPKTFLVPNSTLTTSSVLHQQIFGKPRSTRQDVVAVLRVAFSCGAVSGVTDETTRK